LEVTAKQGFMGQQYITVKNQVAWSGYKQGQSSGKLNNLI
jgi:hypothetical protein